MAPLIFINSAQAYSLPPLFPTIGQHSQLARELAGRWKGMHAQLAHFASHSFFLARCRDMGLTPKGLRLHLIPTSAKEERLKESCERQWVQVKRRAAASRCAQLRAGIASVQTRLENLLPPALMSRLSAACKDHYDRSFAAIEVTKAKKYNNLVCKRTWEFTAKTGTRLPRPDTPRAPPPTPPLFLNLSRTQPIPEEIAALSLGSKFGLAELKVPLANIASRVEYGAQSLAGKGRKEESEMFRTRAIEVVKAIPGNVPANITEAQRIGIKSLCRDKSRIVLRADKSETLVVMDRNDYDTKLDEMMLSGSYKILKPVKNRSGQEVDPAETASRKFAKELQAVFIDSAVPDVDDTQPPTNSQSQTQDHEPEEEEGEPRGKQAALKQSNPRRFYEYRSVRKTHGVASAVHCLPKTHKLGPPPRTEAERVEYVSALKMRIIAPSYASVDRPLCQHLTQILNCLPRPAHSLMRLEDGVEAIQKFSPNPSSILVSFDVISMYPSISIEKSCEVIEKQLTAFDGLEDVTTLRPTEISRLLRFCLSNTILQTKPETWWLQTKGLAMGKSISSAVAERYMISLEEQVAGESDLQPSLYLRWVDDSFAVWDHGLDRLKDEFLPLLNSLDPDVQWTVEVEKDKTLSFLDISIRRHPSHLETTVHRKESNIRHFVPATSHHPLAHKLSAIRHGFRRAYKYCSTEKQLRSEVTDLYEMFRANGYSHLTIAEIETQVRRQLRHPKPQEPDAKPHDAPIKIGVPYLGPWNRKLQRLGNRFSVFFAPSNRRVVRRAFPSPKVAQGAAIIGGTIYLIECKCPDGKNALYCGQTGGRLKDRTSQHEKDWNNRRGAKGAFSEHPGNAGHQVQLDSVSVLATEGHYQVRVILEAFHIAHLSASGEQVITNENLATRDGPRINKSDGIRLSPLWRPIIAKL